jgi:hypothetical protein
MNKAPWKKVIRYTGEGRCPVPGFFWIPFAGMTIFGLIGVYVKPDNHIPGTLLYGTERGVFTG